MLGVLSLEGVAIRIALVLSALLPRCSRCMCGRLTLRFSSVATVPSLTMRRWVPRVADCVVVAGLKLRSMRSAHAVELRSLSEEKLSISMIQRCERE